MYFVTSQHPYWFCWQKSLLLDDICCHWGKAIPPMIWELTRKKLQFSYVFYLVNFDVHIKLWNCRTWNKLIYQHYTQWSKNRLQVWAPKIESLFLKHFYWFFSGDRKGGRKRNICMREICCLLHTPYWGSRIWNGSSEFEGSEIMPNQLRTLVRSQYILVLLLFYAIPTALNLIFTHPIFASCPFIISLPSPALHRGIDFPSITTY